MNESDDLLEKADAFLKRYHPSGHSSRDDVPILTEVVSDTDPGNEGTAPAPAVSPKPDVSDMEQRLTQSVLSALGPHIVKVLEEPLRIRLEAHLHRTLAAFSSQLKLEIEALIHDAVTRAVEAESTRLRGPSRRT